MRARLRQLQWLYDRLLTLESDLQQEAFAEMSPDTPKPVVLKQLFTEQSVRRSDPELQAQLQAQKSDELRILLEAFYYSAHRVRDILRDHKTDLPKIVGFECSGIRDVRNHLVEHPGRAKGVLVFSVACGGPVGPQLRLLRWSLDPKGSDDQGLHHNAKEFENALPAGYPQRSPPLRGGERSGDDRSRCTLIHPTFLNSTMATQQNAAPFVQSLSGRAAASNPQWSPPRPAFQARRGDRSLPLR